MKQITIILLNFLICGNLILNAQQISGVNFIQKGQHIEIRYNILGGKFNQLFYIKVYVSIDGGNHFIGPLMEVRGDVGDGVKSGRNKTIMWNAILEMPDFGGDVVFDVRALVSTEKVKNKFFIGYKGSSQAPIGLVMGLTGKVGFNVSARLNSNVLTKYEYYETDGKTIPDYDDRGYYTFTGNDMTQRLSITINLQFQTGRKTHLYLGAGYALYNLLWEIDQYNSSDEKYASTWVRHSEESFSILEFETFEAETGIMFVFGHVFLSAGISIPGFQWVEPTFSIGGIF